MTRVIDQRKHLIEDLLPISEGESVINMVGRKASGIGHQAAGSRHGARTLCEGFHLTQKHMTESERDWGCHGLFKPQSPLLVEHLLQ